MKNIIKSLNYNEKNINQLGLYKMKDNNNNFILKKTNDKRRLLHFALMEFIKNNNKISNNSIIEPSLYIKNSLGSTNKQIQKTKMKKKIEKKKRSNYLNRNEFCNSTNGHVELDISTNEKNCTILNNKFKGKSHNSSFNCGLNFLLNKNKEKKIYIQNRVHSTVEKNTYKNNELFGKNRFEEDVIIDYQYAMNSNELKNNNIVYIKKKNKNIKINDFSNVPYIKKEPILKENQKNQNNFEEDKNKYSMLKKNQSLPNMNSELNEKNTKNKKINSSYIPNNINHKINYQRNDNFFYGKNRTSYFSSYEKKKRPKKIIEYIYDNNINANFHFQSIKFGLGSNVNNFPIFNNYTDNEGYKEEIIVKTFKNDKFFLNRELMLNYLKCNEKNVSKQKKASLLSRRSTEENKNNSTNKIDERNQSNNSNNSNNNSKDFNVKNDSINKKIDIKTFYKKKYDKFDIKTSILHFKEGQKNEKFNDVKKNLNNKSNNKEKLYLTAKSCFTNFKKNKINEQAPVIINKYISKRKKNNNDDIIGLI